MKDCKMLNKNSSEFKTSQKTYLAGKHFVNMNKALLYHRLCAKMNFTCLRCLPNRKVELKNQFFQNDSFNSPSLTTLWTPWNWTLLCSLCNGLFYVTLQSCKIFSESNMLKLFVKNHSFLLKQLKLLHLFKISKLMAYLKGNSLFYLKGI